jgi:TM2 domain-containing membrane protein YozV
MPQPVRSRAGARKPIESPRGRSDPSRALTPKAAAALLAGPMLVHEPKRKRTVLLLCLFLGWLGCHRYYIGKRGTARLYLLTGGFLMIGVVLDLILILTDSFEDRFGQPLV